MKHLIVLGPGCPRCEALADLTRQAADRLGIDYRLDKLQDISQFASYGLMMTPGLVVDGELRVHGRLPSLEEITALLSEPGGLIRASKAESK